MKSNPLTPELYVSDFEKSLIFYTKILGFNIEYQREKPLFAFLSYQESQLMIQEQEKHWQTGPLEYPYGRGINFQIKTDNLQQLLDNLKRDNYPLKDEPEENWYRVNGLLRGVREFNVMDPDGYLLRFSQDIGTKTA